MTIANARRVLSLGDLLHTRLTGYADGYEAASESGDAEPPEDGWAAWTIGAIGHEAFYEACLSNSLGMPWTLEEQAHLTALERSFLREVYALGADHGAVAGVADRGRIALLG